MRTTKIRVPPTASRRCALVAGFSWLFKLRRGLGVGAAALFGSMTLVPGCSDDSVPTAADEGSPKMPTLALHRAPFIAFDAFTPDGDTDIFLYDVETHSMVDLPGLNDPDRGDRRPSISADGRFIAFESDRGNPACSIGTGTHLYDRARSAFVALPRLNDVGCNGTPAISDDGNLIAFVGFSRETSSVDVFLYSRLVNGVIPLPGLNSPAVDRGPDISGNGDFIVFETDRRTEQAFNVFLYRRATRQLFVLSDLNTGTTNEVEAGLPEGGRRIVFERNRDIFLYNRNTESLVDLPGLNTFGFEIFPAISSSGQYIAYICEDDESTSVCLYNREVSSRVPLPGLDAVASRARFPSVSH